MKLRTRFILSLLAVLVVMAVPALLGVTSVRAVRSTALDLRERTAEAAYMVGRIQTGLERLDRYQRTYVATGDPELGELTRQAVASVGRDLDRLRSAGYAEAVDQARIPVPMLSAVSSLTSLLMEAGHAEAATQLLRYQLTPLILASTESAETLAGAVDALTAARLSSVDEITGRAVTITTTALLLGLLVAGLLTLLTARYLTRPLNRLSTSMARVANGDFHPPENLPYERQDEVGELFRTFRSMALQLADLDRMKAEFVGIATHDLKTPINVISGYAELLAEELPDELGERHRQILDSLGRQTRTLSTRLNQLLEISRIQAAGLQLGLEEINLRHFAVELGRSYTGLGSRHGITVAATVDDSAPSFLIADPDILREEVFGHLLENAIKFSPRGGRIEIRVAGLGGMVTFAVRDQGPPIPPESRAHVFDRYYRGRDASGRVGAGLGLPIARAGVEAHGGTIEVDSHPATGETVFLLTLPIHPTHLTAASPRRQPA